MAIPCPGSLNPAWIGPVRSVACRLLYPMGMYIGHAPIRILLLDADARARGALAALLQGDGCVVRALGRDETAELETLERPDVVVSVHRDREPWLLAVLAEAGARWPGVRLFSVSTGGTVAHDLEVHGVHPIRWFDKPLRYDELLASVCRTGQTGGTGLISASA